MLIFSFLLPTSLVSGNSTTVPDYINLEYETVPNVLLADIPTQTPDQGGVSGTLVLENPLNSLYLAYD